MNACCVYISCYCILNIHFNVFFLFIEVSISKSSGEHVAQYPSILISPCSSQSHEPDSFQKHQGNNLLRVQSKQQKVARKKTPKPQIGELKHIK
jgi:hypothetical protein